MLHRLLLPQPTPQTSHTRAMVDFRKPLEEAENRRGEKHKKGFVGSESRKGAEPGVSGREMLSPCHSLWLCLLARGEDLLSHTGQESGRLDRMEQMGRSHIFAGGGPAQ